MGILDTTLPATPRSRRVLGFVIAVLLLGAAVWSVSNSVEAMGRLRAGVGGAPAWVLVLLLVLPISNWLLTGALFHALTRPRAAVSPGHMTAIVGAAWLLNFLPLSPGLFGRLAYQKAALNLPVRTSVRIVLESLATGWVVFAFALAATHEATHGWGRFTWAGAWIGTLIAAMVPVSRRRPAGLSSAYALAFALKSVDFALWALRYLVLLILLGHEGEPTHAVALALVAQTAVLVPLIGNGLGVREWLVGLVAAALPTWFIFASPTPHASPMASGVALDLVGRAAEVIVAVPIGLACAAWLANRSRTAGSGNAARSDAAGGS